MRFRRTTGLLCLAWLLGCEDVEQGAFPSTSEILGCNGRVHNALCYADGEVPPYADPYWIVSPMSLYGEQPILEDDDFPVKVTLSQLPLSQPLAVGEQFELRVSIANTAAESLVINGSVYATPKWAIDAATSDPIPFELNEPVTIASDCTVVSSSEQVEYTMRGKVLAQSLFESQEKLTVVLGSCPPPLDMNVFQFGKLEQTLPLLFTPSPDEAIKCGGRLFPAQSDAFDTSVCCPLAQDGDPEVFVPAGQCCENTDCLVTEVCVDARCVTPLATAGRPAKGIQQLVVIDASPTDQSNPSEINEVDCSVTDVRYTELAVQIESYFDARANEHLHAESDFIDFQWFVFSHPELSRLSKQLMLGETAGHHPILPLALEALKANCNAEFDREPILVIVDEHASTYCGNSEREPDACVAQSEVIVLRPFAFTDWRILAHELAHVFGCTDLYPFTSRFAHGYQWSNALMANHNYVSPSLSVCRGEMGWADGNRNGIADIHDVFDHGSYVEWMPAQAN
jgi:hypothetical protein